MTSKRDLGVIIARFQAPSLTDAHRYLIKQVATRVDRILILLGVAPVPFTKKNPLEFSIRSRMVYEWCEVEFPDKQILVLPLFDCPTDKEWVGRVDQAVSSINIGGGATVFCGPDGAGPIYSLAGGNWPIEVLDSAGGHASKVRFELNPRFTEDFRAGVIYGVERRYTNPFVCIDVMIHDEKGNLLLGHKTVDRRPEGDGREWRLVGGFVDLEDVSLERAVRRETLEETGLEISEPIYVGSTQVDDWRYRSGPEGILSAVFSCQRVFGKEIAKDDIDELKWFTKAEAKEVIHPIHEHLLHLGLKVQ